MCVWRSSPFCYYRPSSKYGCLPIGCSWKPVIWLKNSQNCPKEHFLIFNERNQMLHLKSWFIVWKRGFHVFRCINMKSINNNLSESKFNEITWKNIRFSEVMIPELVLSKLFFTHSWKKGPNQEGQWLRMLERLVSRAESKLRHTEISQRRDIISVGLS